mgnify:FL=1|tara:strand:- start:240 stop:722 length:483 start_codon:yes stop_codon:yes gene_type:complete
MSAAQGFSIGEGQGHYVNALPPIDINVSAQTSDSWTMAKHSHATIILQFGVVGAATTFTLEQATDSSGTSAEAIGFSYYSETSSGGDTLSARTTATASGVATGTTNNVTYIIELDSEELTDGYTWLRVQLTDPGTATVAGVSAVLSGARYAEVEGLTAIV